MSGVSFGEIFFDILTYGVFSYSVLLILSYILIGLFSIGETRKYIWENEFTDYRVIAASAHSPSVTILAPAYNEGKNIVENVRSLLSIFYVNMEVVIINDGSKDDTLSKLIEAYDLEKKDYFIDQQIVTKNVRGVYKSRKSIYHKLIVVDKENGGKADALNVGINISSSQYLVCIDVDCILEQDAVLKMIKPFLEQKEKKVIASGGVIRIANSCVIEDGRLIKVRLATEYLPRMQILEYIRAFILGRMAWTRLNGLMLISGAFGAFDREIAIKAGGYNHNTVGEDMELVVRMRRYMEELKQDYIVTYIPDPLCWTEAPSTFTILGRQRNRWIRGTYETLMLHKVMFFNPKYRLLGMLSYPYWFFFEMCAPVIEFFGFIFFVIFAWTGFMNWDFFFSFFLFIICFGYLYSVFSIFMEVVTFNQYQRRIDIFHLMVTGLTEPFYYHPFVVWSAMKGYLDLIKKKKGWGEMTRQGLNRKKVPPVSIVPVTENSLTQSPTSAAPPEATVDVEKIWVMERVILPAIIKASNFIARSLIYYCKHTLVLWLLLVLARAFELGYDIVQHGRPPLLGEVVVTGLLKDALFFLRTGAVFCLPFMLFHLLHRKAAHVFYIVYALILLLTQVSLSSYFVTTLVPLGADLWGYSMADIRQTVGASGGLTPLTITVFILFTGLVLFFFIFLPRRISLNSWVAALLVFLFSTSVFSKMPELVNAVTLDEEYSNNLATNKSSYFIDASLRHFIPPVIETDIYSSSYSGDFSTSAEDANLSSINYVDEKNYPFLHTTDSSQEVLSPFFNKAYRPPNIVIILVEGLGRAFTNKGAYLGNFTPFIDSLSGKSLYWENFLSEGGRTFAVLPSLLGSLPFTKNGFTELGNAMPQHFSLLNLLKKNGYQTSFYYGGDAHFDNMDIYLRKNAISVINDEKTFPSGYTKMPSQSGFSWGYGDKELFRRFLETKKDTSRPQLSVVLTVSTHNPFLINEQEKYMQKFEARMIELGFSGDTKKKYRNYANQYASILFADDAISGFINQYKQRPDFANTVFLITGDHRMPEIPMSTKIDRYHVPLLIYSPLLNRTAKFSSISTHFDITPSILAWLRKDYRLQLPDKVAWMGTGLDTARSFRNIHAYPMMQTKTELVDFIKGDYHLNNNDLFHISNRMDLNPEVNDVKSNELKSGFNRFLLKNEAFAKTLRLIPDSLLRKYLPQ